MIITCPECDTKYRYDERRFDGDAVKKVKCTSCGFTFEVANPTLESVASDSPTDLGREEHPQDAPPSSEGWNAELADFEVPTPIPVPAAAPPKPAPASEPEAPMPTLPTDLRYSLAVIAGGQAGTVFQIHKSRIYLGRGSAMDIQLRDSEISRRHVKLEIRDPEVSLTDLGATNGTWFNGAKVESVTINHQDEFTLGSTTLMLIVTPVQGSR